MSMKCGHLLQKMDSEEFKRHITIQTLQRMCETIIPTPRSVGIADLGCSSVPSTLSNVKQLVLAAENASEGKTREFHVYLNDLPTNDFNKMFRALPSLFNELESGRNKSGPAPPVYIYGCPGTFYGRLFPGDSLHFVYASNSLHYLSRIPPDIYDEKGMTVNKKSIYLSERSPAQVSQAYSKQYREDFSVFLKSRSEEVMSGGQMVIILMGRGSSCPVDKESTFFWEMLYQSLHYFATQGEFEEEKLDAYDVPFYAPSKEELEDEVRKEGSFEVEMVEKVNLHRGHENYPSYGMAVAQTVRRYQETEIARHFGEAILDKLFDHYGRLVDLHLATEDIKPFSLVVVLAKP